MKITLGIVGRLVVAGALLPVWGWADEISAANPTANGATSTGEAGMILTQNLYCSTSNLLEGNIGLMLGLLLVFLGIWSLIRGGKMVPAFVTILSGALVTALPSLTESAFQGVGNLLIESGLSKSGSSYAPPTCGEEKTPEISDDKHDNGYCTGGYQSC